MTTNLDTAQGHLESAQSALAARADLYLDLDASNRAQRLEALGASARTGLQLGTLAAAIDLAESARRLADRLDRHVAVDARACSEDLGRDLLDERYGLAGRKTVRG